MAKIKVHELAKELEIKSKDVITFLQEKGVDVKAAQSSIEGDAVEWVKKKFAAANKEPSDQKDSSRIGQAAQTERKAQVEKAETAEKTTQTAAVQAEGREEQTTDKQDMNKEVVRQEHRYQPARYHDGGGGNDAQVQYANQSVQFLGSILPRMVA